ncbi:uncharacterized protein METZ01_LOCUS182410, partial [marine metagenome]
MSESEQNVPKGIRANYPKRPAIDEDAWAKIRASQERMKDREFVRFSIFKVDPAWRQLASVERDQHKDEFEALIASKVREMMIYSYALVGTRGDGDF